MKAAKEVVCPTNLWELPIFKRIYRVHGADGALGFFRILTTLASRDGWKIADVEDLADIAEIDSKLAKKLIDIGTEKQWLMAKVGEISLGIIAQETLLAKTIKRRERNLRYVTGKRSGVKKEKSKKRTSTVFKKPEKNDVYAYLRDGKYVIGKSNLMAVVNNFFDFYDSKGWKVGSVSMKDWKASVRRSLKWDINDKQTPQHVAT